MSNPSFPEQVRLVEAFLGRQLPDRVLELFRRGSPTARRLLPLATGHEHDPPPPDASPADAFTAARARFDSVLGRAMGNAEVQRFAPDDVWPAGLLIVEDYGCAIYRAIDLNDPHLRVIEHEHLYPVEDPQAAAGPTTQLAYSEPAVPRHRQHQFIILARTLDDWLEGTKLV